MKSKMVWFLSRTDDLPKEWETRKVSGNGLEALGTGFTYWNHYQVSRFIRIH